MYLAHRHVDPQGLHTDIIRHSYVHACNYLFVEKMIHTAWLYLKWMDTWVQGISWACFVSCKHSEKQLGFFYKQAVKKQNTHIPKHLQTNDLDWPHWCPIFFFVKKWCTHTYAHRHVHRSAGAAHRCTYTCAVFFSLENDTHSMTVPQVNGHLDAGYFMGVYFTSHMHSEKQHVLPQTSSQKRIHTYTPKNLQTNDLDWPRWCPIFFSVEKWCIHTYARRHVDLQEKHEQQRQRHQTQPADICNITSDFANLP